MVARKSTVAPAAPARSDESTRTRMLAAAVECILEEGYYRASSNRIAARAGVTWGVIQYHFGTREQLLLAVVRDGVDDLLHRLQDAKITGGTIEERLESLADVFWEYYRRPQFLAHLQVLLNLGKDPRTSEATRKALAAADREVGRLLQGLVDDVVPEAKRDDDLGIAIFELMRGAAIGECLIEGLPHRKRKRVHDARATLVSAVALLLTD